MPLRRLQPPSVLRMMVVEHLDLKTLVGRPVCQRAPNANAVVPSRLKPEFEAQHKVRKLLICE
jgi:hypothetical protein